MTRAALGLAKAVLGALLIAGGAVAGAEAQTQGSAAIGVEVRGFGETQDSRAPGLVVQFARDMPQPGGWAWRFAGQTAVTTAAVRNGRAWGTYFFVGPSVGPDVSGVDPYFRIGGGLLQLYTSHPFELIPGVARQSSRTFFGLAGYAAIGVGLSRRYFAEAAVLVPTTDRFGSPLLSLVIGWRRSRDTEQPN